MSSRAAWIAALFFCAGCTQSAKSENPNADGSRSQDVSRESGDQSNDDNSIAEERARQTMLAKRAAIARENAKTATIWQPAGYSQCNKLLALSIETDAKGLNIRDKPNGKIIGTVPPMVESGGLSGAAGPMFTILGSQDGWFHVESIGIDEQIAERKVKPGYLGKGWVSGRKINFNVQSVLGFDRPHNVKDPLRFEPGNSHADKMSKIVIDLETGNGSELKYDRAVACQNDWLLVDFSTKSPAKPATPTTATGWFRGICDALETSCDRLASDY